MSSRKKNSLRKRVGRAYSQDALARICTLPEYKFGRAFGMQTVKVAQKWPADYYHFRDNGSSVLAVAHLDTVVDQGRRTPYFYDTKSGPYINSGALDDRLGAYVILKLLPALGIRCDWLLTTGEENCQSTASFFDPGKEYDWIIEFDRMGTDVVMYQYEDEASRKAVQASGAAVGDGSYSDIGCLEHLGVKAFNWGVGYQGNYHSVAGYAYLSDTFGMVAKFLRFHALHAGAVMPHEPAWPSWRDRQDYGELACEICEKVAVDPVTETCGECGSCQGCYMASGDCLCYTPATLPAAAADDDDAWAAAGYSITSPDTDDITTELAG